MRDSMPILLVDDDSTDVILFQRALEHLQITNPVIRSTNCKEALEYLENQYNEKPWIVITDLNTAEMNGFEFLRTVKAHEALRQTIIIVLSGSSDERDIAESFKLGAAGYMVKPFDYEQLVEMIRVIHAYWTLSERPHASVISQLDRPSPLQ